MRTYSSYRLVGFLAVIATLAIGSTASAQSSQNQGGGSQGGFGVQVLGGPNFGNFTDVTGPETGYKAGYLVGLGFGGNRGGVVGVEADVLYGQKASLVNRQTFSQHVVDVPVMLKVNIGASNRNGPSIFALGGGFFDWQFDSKLNDVDISKDTNGYEVGLVLGGGVEVLRFSVQARYYRGLREIDRTFNLGSSTDIETQAFAVLFGFRIN